MGSLWIQRITSLMVNVNLMVMVKVDKDIHIMVIGKDQPHDDDYITHYKNITSSQSSSFIMIPINSCEYAHCVQLHCTLF